MLIKFGRFEVYKSWWSKWDPTHDGWVHWSRYPDDLWTTYCLSLGYLTITVVVYRDNPESLV